MTPSTNICTVRMERDGSFEVTINGRTVPDVIEVGVGTRQRLPEDEGNVQRMDDGDYEGQYVTLTMQVAQYNLIEPAPTADETEREWRGKLICAHEDGKVILERTAFLQGAQWRQANISRDGWRWNDYEYKILPD